LFSHAGLFLVSSFVKTQSESFKNEQFDQIDLKYLLAIQLYFFLMLE
jgi:hypothetical protein